ncbi:hypothetical protein NMG60_11034896 [Bertholletia excelsa]
MSCPVRSPSTCSSLSRWLPISPSSILLRFNWMKTDGTIVTSSQKATAANHISSSTSEAILRLTSLFFQ